MVAVNENVTSVTHLFADITSHSQQSRHQKRESETYPMAELTRMKVSCLTVEVHQLSKTARLLGLEQDIISLFGMHRK